ncbi:MAG: hypothetical protein A3D31_06160 [Candidatus Fluviicola riflensis]|nr:MAG: hypothetical protein CHH17_08855 [Candidatus Fluviicola riflensis]OGS79546.1 MAG: hypothetical protein A3D31_06160 [Candidatus Fluviicola riflensis]OGS86977.1 MAG: hypothetical protein A2724_05620 [Fluviicola sp. RIFCSPHIGHO2_01_FULL_43_53]OGS89768.1 MAG: hypothetical protein A3E30_02365 [Fluviicola sp. RIFCSPHIGHO2_12_FULL_43_24]
MQNFIDRASNLPVINGAAKIKSDNLPLGYILDPSNPLVSNSIDAVKNNFLTGIRCVPLSLEQVNTYMAASSLLHSLDGWVYLSHAVESLLKGDNGISIHLAYYAELRASMSFLASEGIGIFDHQHIHVDSSNLIAQDPGVRYYNRQRQRYEYKRVGTHIMVWEAIEKWSTSNVKPINSEILKVFSVNGKTFEEWVNAFPYSGTVTGTNVIKQWMKDWNFDVNFFTDDRRMRNEVSYRPQRLNINPPTYTVNEVIKELSSYWDILEPYQTNKFQLLDKHLLRILLQKMYTNLSPTIKTNNSLEEIIVDTLNNLGETHNPSIIDFLKDVHGTHKIFTEAQNKALDPITNSLNPLSVIARATLMLRISTGNTSLIFKNAGVDKSDLSDLWESYGVENGFWNAGSTPNDFTELWDDIKDHIEDVTSWAISKSPDLSLFQIYDDGAIPNSFNYFKQFHRACLWGI